jgi:hypothetical protein
VALGYSRTSLLRLTALISVVALVVVLLEVRFANTGAKDPRPLGVVGSATDDDAQVPLVKNAVASRPVEARTSKHGTRSKRSDDVWIPANRTGPPFAEIREALVAAARSGDASAASELSHATQYCRWAKDQDDIPDPTTQLVPGGNWNGLRETDRSEFLRLIDDWRYARAVIAKNRWYCEGLDHLMTDDRAVLDAELRAARLGDTQADDCFVENAALFATPGTHMGPNPNYNAAVAKPFADAALEIAIQGVERGDWRMVAALASAYSAQGANIYSFVLAQPDPDHYYAYATLLRLGHTDPEQLQREREMPLDPAVLGVDAETARALESWAEETYERYFLNSEPLPYPSYYSCDPP